MLPPSVYENACFSTASPKSSYQSERGETGGGCLSDVLVSDLAWFAVGTLHSSGAGAGISSNGNNASWWPGTNASSGDTHGMDPHCHLQNFPQRKAEHAFIIHLTSNARSEEPRNVCWNRKGNCATAVPCIPGFKACFPAVHISSRD